MSYRTKNSNDYSEPERGYIRNNQYDRYKIDTDHNRNSKRSNNQDSQYSNYNNGTRNSQYEEEYSMGVPSLPSSIIHYHQKMTNVNVVMSGKVPVFSPHAFHASQASSLESSDTNYTDNTSMLPCVGSSITSGNPTGMGISSLQHTTNNNSVTHQNATENSQNISPMLPSCSCRTA